jgi:MFS family permease
MIFWGRVADRYGRKPVLVFSLAGLAVAVTLFGTSRNVWQMVLFRCLAGLFSGSVVFVYPFLVPFTSLMLSVISILFHSIGYPRF